MNYLALDIALNRADVIQFSYEHDYTFTASCWQGYFRPKQAVKWGPR